MSTPSPMPVHDLFDWWANIWIPSLLGLATVVVSIAAVIASIQAGRLGRQVEAQRAAAADERAQDEGRKELRRMALQEARLLSRYVVEATTPSGASWSIGEGGAATSGGSRDTVRDARLAARVALEQSLVPAAGELYEITVFEVTKRRSHLPAGTAAERDAVIQKRIDRTMGRIRIWALDPASMLTPIRAEHAQMLLDEESYLLDDPDRMA